MRKQTKDVELVRNKSVCLVDVEFDNSRMGDEAADVERRGRSRWGGSCVSRIATALGFRPVRSIFLPLAALSARAKWMVLIENFP
jgi:hypothetical protein